MSPFQALMFILTVPVVSVIWYALPLFTCGLGRHERFEDCPCFRCGE